MLSLFLFTGCLTLDRNREYPFMFRPFTFQLISATLSIFLLQVTLAAQSPDQSETISCLVDIRQNEFGEWYGEVEMPPIEASLKYDLKLKIRNNTKNDFSFSSVKPGCSCYSFELPNRKIPANKDIDARVKFAAPASSPKADYGVGADFIGENGAMIGRIAIKAKVNGNLYIEPPVNVRVKSAEVSEILLPIYLTEPNKISNLEVDGEDSFEENEVVGTIFEKENQPYLRVLFRSPNRNFSTTSGTLTIRDKVSLKKIDLPLLLIEQAPVEVLPMITSFRETTGDQGSTQFVTKCLLKINTDPEIVTEKEPDVEVSATINGRPLTVKANRLSRNVYRIFASSSQEDLSPSATEKVKQKINWEIKINNDLFEIDSLYHIE